MEICYLPFGYWSRCECVSQDETLAITAKTVDFIFVSRNTGKQSLSITAFGEHLVSVEGPYVFLIEVLTHKLMHKFYVLDSP